MEIRASTSNKFSVIMQKDTHGYYGFSPDLPGCQTQGDSLEETVANMKEAITLYLETLSEQDLSERSHPSSENRQAGNAGDF